MSLTMKEKFFKLFFLLTAVMVKVINVRSTFCEDYYTQLNVEWHQYKQNCRDQSGIRSPCCVAEEESMSERWQNYWILCPFEGPKNCADWYNCGLREDGIYTINPDSQGVFQVRCDMTTAGGGWTVLQRRLDGSVDFYRVWSEYRKGFGDLNGEFWLGLDKIHRLLKSGLNVLRVDLEDFEKETSYAVYNKFAIANESDYYRLTVGDYSGDAGDSLASHNQLAFSTKDRDNYVSPWQCARNYVGAWWYSWCHKSNLNGIYYHIIAPYRMRTSEGQGIQWSTWKGFHYSLKKADMKIRPPGF